MIASLGNKKLQKTKVSHWKNCWFIYMTAKKRKRKTEPVCDCNQGECAVAKKKNLTLSVWLKKKLGCLDMIASLGNK
jgi:hypothetical protein